MSYEEKKLGGQVLEEVSMPSSVLFKDNTDIQGTILQVI